MEDPEVKRERQRAQAAHARSAKLKKYADIRKLFSSVHLQIKKDVLKVFSEEAERQGIHRSVLMRNVIHEYAETHLRKKTNKSKGWGR